jgi:hypothetical protein
MILPRPSSDPRGMSLPGLLLLIVCTLTLASLGTMAFLQFGIWGVLIFALIVAGLIIIGLAAYLVARWFAGRKAASFEQQLSAPVASGGTSDPAEAARREEFREKFQAGLKTLTDSGKNLTRFPLYVMVGEPGAGKTEAIRHSSIRFPQGINDLLQGVGGTYNMDWWFTNDAVILDTAGALLLEQSNKAQFEEFLGLLKQYRPDYPITGLVLAIPADSLLVDGERGLEEKAGRIVAQFAVLQESLDLRYPVYVMVTKCDLITGFREFFDAPGNDTFESQMLGWSNPDPLDQPFEPSRTGRLLEPLAERLQRIRDQLLSADWPSGPELRRLDFLDAVYAFPGEFRRLLDPLGKYLEILFRPDHWKNQRPPFFRGIYFTSSLRQGAVLDQELAAALNMPVSRLPDVKGYQTDKSLFLRDFFLEKLFRESGLVTRLTNVAAGLRNRLMRFYLVTASVLLLLLLTGWFASQRLDKRLAAERNLWKLANQTWDNGTFLPMFERSGPERTWRYTGDEPVMNSEFTRLAYQKKLSGEVGKGLGWGTYFAPLPAYRQLKHDRERAQIVIVEGSIIRPLLQAVRENLRDSKRAVASEDEVAATLALVEIEAYLEQAKRLSDPEDIARLFNPLYRLAAPATFAAANGQAAAATEMAKTLNGIISSAWERLDDSDLDRMRWMAEGPPYRAIDRGMRLFTLHKTRLDQRQTESDEKTRLREEKAANFMRHEDELWTLRQNLDDFKEIETWLVSLTALGKELDEIGDPAAYAMRRATYAEHDARLRRLLPDLPSLLARDVKSLLESAGNPDAAWIAVEDKQRTFDPQSDKAIVWAAYLNPAEDGTPLYRKRLDALLKHFPLLNPEDELTRRFQPPDPGQLQAVILSLAKLVEERAKIADAYPEAPQLPKVEPDPKADPAKVRASAEAAQRLQKRLNELSERGKVITEYLDHGTKDLLNAKYLAGPFDDALKAQQALIFRKPFGNRDPALVPTTDFPRAAAVITALAADFAACDTLAVDSRHYQLKQTLESLRLKVGDRAVTKRSRFEIILQAKNAVADEGNAVRTIPVELGPFSIANLVEEKRKFKLMPPFFEKEEEIIAKGIRQVKVGRPQSELGAKPEAKLAALGELLLSDPIQVVVEWEDAEGRGNMVQSAGGPWGTLNFILARSTSSAAARRQVDVLDALSKKLTLFFTFPSAYPAGQRPTGFE